MTDRLTRAPAWTKGPWFIEPCKADPCLVSIGTGVREEPEWHDLARVVTAVRDEDGGSAKPDYEGEANARLIAAAPELADYVRRHADAGDEEARALWEKCRGR